MLIVNADDLGASPTTSDPIIDLYAERLLSSASAMVRMSDSTRAAALASEHELPAGLHLNLTMAFTQRSLPAPVRERQLHVTEIFGAESWRDGHESPDGQLLGDVIEDQLECFRETFGEPTHLDGHHHIHTHPAVLERLPGNLPVRPVLSVPARAPTRPSPGERELRRRFLSPELCFALESVHPALGGSGLQALEPARRGALEIMVHPRQEAQCAALRSAEWRCALSTLRLGSYADFARAHRPRAGMA